MEVEIKAKATKGLEDKVRSIANFVRETKEHNIIYNSEFRDFKKTGELVRVRKEEKGLILTYKKKLESDEVKRRIERERLVDENIYEVLETLGFHVDLEYSKKRKYFEFGNIEISLDKVKDLGDFIELESKGASEKELFELLEKLEVPKENIVKKSYPQLIRESK